MANSAKKTLASLARLAFQSSDSRGIVAKEETTFHASGQRLSAYPVTPKAAIDLANHVVTTEGYGLPDSVAAAFLMLAKHGVIDDGLAERMRRMVGFRNTAVQDYEALDPNVLRAIVERHLDDLRAVARIVIEKFGIIGQ